MAKTYKEKLLDPRWQRRRLEIFNRDNFTCQKCGDNESTISVHHRWYAYGKEPWEYPDDILVTLCENCHKEEEEAKDNHRYIKNAFLICGYYNTELEQLADDIIYSIGELGKEGFSALIKEIAEKERSRERSKPENS